MGHLHSPTAAIISGWGALLCCDSGTCCFVGVYLAEEVKCFRGVCSEGALANPRPLCLSCFIAPATGWDVEMGFSWLSMMWQPGGWEDEHVPLSL